MFSWNSFGLYHTKPYFAICRKKLTLYKWSEILTNSINSDKIVRKTNYLMRGEEICQNFLRSLATDSVRSV